MTEEKHKSPTGKSSGRKHHPVAIAVILVAVLGTLFYFLFSSYPLRNGVTMVDRKNDIVWFRSLNVKIDGNVAQYCIDIKDYQKAAILSVDLIRQKPDNIKGYLLLAETLQKGPGNSELAYELLKLGDIGLKLAEPADRVRYHQLKAEILASQDTQLGTDHRKEIEAAAQEALKALKGENFGMGDKTQAVAIQKILFENALNRNNPKMAKSVLDALMSLQGEDGSRSVYEYELALASNPNLTEPNGVKIAAGPENALYAKRMDYLNQIAELRKLQVSGDLKGVAAGVESILGKTPEYRYDRLLVPLIEKAGVQTAVVDKSLKEAYEKKSKEVLVRWMEPESVAQLKAMNQEVRKQMESGQR